MDISYIIIWLRKSSSYIVRSLEAMRGAWIVFLYGRNSWCKFGLDGNTLITASIPWEILISHNEQAFQDSGLRNMLPIVDEACHQMMCLDLRICKLGSLDVLSAFKLVPWTNLRSCIGWVAQFYHEWSFNYLFQDGGI